MQHGDVESLTRKGIFDPSHFGISEILAIYVAVILADIILLDLYSTFGLPTSTTVSVVFELLGAAVAVAYMSHGTAFLEMEVINGASALRIITGILLSVPIAFGTASRSCS